MNVKKIILAAMLVSSMTIGLMGCSTINDGKNDNTEKADKDTNDVIAEEQKENVDDNKPVANSTNKLEDNNKSSQDSTKKGGDVAQEKPVASNDNIKDKVCSENNITEKIKNYIINDQENKPEAQKIKWSKTFLDQVDIESLYKKYIANAGKTDDLESFANYMNLNAPIYSGWEDLFKKDLYDAYGEKVVRLEPLKDNLYQAYIVKEGSEVPYVVVSSRTGYFHG